MHILVTDVLSCPRCGPGFTLILLADRVEARRVHAGMLACPNCRERYPVRTGVAEVVAAGEPEVTGIDDAAAAEDPAGPVDAEERAFRLLALLGIAEPPALVLLAGPLTALAPLLAARVEGLEAICVGGSAPAAAGVTRLRVGARLPLQSRSMRGVALSGAAADQWLEEGARVTGGLGRILLERPPVDAAARLEDAGLRVIAAQDSVLLATRG